MFLLGKWGTLQRERPGGAKVDRVLVSELRRYARQEGFGQLQRDQIRHLQQTGYGYGLDRTTLREILTNRSWYDPSYAPGEPDPAYWERNGSLALMAVRVLAR
jgi:hypothetical protein